MQCNVSIASWVTGLSRAPVCQNSTLWIPKGTLWDVEQACCSHSVETAELINAVCIQYVQVVCNACECWRQQTTGLWTISRSWHRPSEASFTTSLSRVTDTDSTSSLVDLPSFHRQIFCEHCRQCFWCCWSGDRKGIWPVKNFSRKSAQRRRKHCTLAVVRRSQKLSSHCRPHSRGCEMAKINQLERVTTFSCKPSLVRIDACNFELLW